jgi:tetratricopeptide (TPR) repeat protein
MIFFARLRKLHIAAGEPKLALVSGRVSQQRLSAWMSHNIPHRFEEFETVLEALIIRAQKRRAPEPEHGMYSIACWRTWWNAARSSRVHIQRRNDLRSATNYGHSSDARSARTNPETSGETFQYYAIDDQTGYSIWPSASMPAAVAGVHKPIVPMLEKTGPQVRMNTLSTVAYPPYIPRSFDQVLAERLQEAVKKRFGSIVLIGSSCTGKTRSCWQAIRADKFRNWSVLVPDETRAIKALLKDPSRIQTPTILWLDELQNYLGPDGSGLTPKHLSNLQNCGAPIILLGTIWADYYSSLANFRADPWSSRFTEAAGFLNQIDHLIPVPNELDDNERRRGAAFASENAVLQEALSSNDFGVTQIIAGAGDLVRHWTVTMSTEAKAMTDAAIDLRRIGVAGPISLSLLSTLAPTYISKNSRNFHKGWLEKALPEAIQELRGATSVLIPTSGEIDDDTFTLVPADYILQHGMAIRANIKISDHFWEMLVGKIDDADDRWRIVNSARARGRLAWAEILADGLERGLPRKQKSDTYDSIIAEARSALTKGSYSESVWRSILKPLPEGIREQTIDRLLREGVTESIPKAFSWLVDSMIQSNSIADAIEVAKKAINTLTDSDVLCDIATAFSATSKAELVIPHFEEKYASGSLVLRTALARLYADTSREVDLANLLRDGIFRDDIDSILGRADQLLRRHYTTKEPNVADFVLYDMYGPLHTLAAWTSDLDPTLVDDAVMVLHAAVRMKLIESRNLAVFFNKMGRQSEALDIAIELLQSSDAQALCDGAELLAMMDRREDAIAALTTTSMSAEYSVLKLCSTLIADARSVDEAISYVIEKIACPRAAAIELTVELLIRNGLHERAIDMLQENNSTYHIRYDLALKLRSSGYGDDVIELLEQGGFMSHDGSSDKKTAEERSQVAGDLLALLAEAGDWKRYVDNLERGMLAAPCLSEVDIVAAVEAVGIERILSILTRACIGDCQGVTKALLNALRETEHFHSAIKTLQPFATPEHLWLLRPLAEAYEDIGDLDVAIILLRAAVKYNDVRPGEHIYRLAGDINAMFGEPEVSINSFKKFITPTERHRSLSILDAGRDTFDFDWQMLTRLLCQKGKFEEAIEVIEMHPDIGTSFKVATVLELAGRRNEAMTRLRQAIVAGETCIFDDFIRFLEAIGKEGAARDIEEVGLDEDGWPAKVAP